MKRRKMIFVGLLIIVNWVVMAVYGDLSADEILLKCDYNSSPDTIVSDLELTINQQNRVDVKKMRMYGKGQEKTYVLFNNPPRDKNTAVLRLGDNMWMYLPSAERTLKISGHMLRQSFMGSDFSNADITERLKLQEKYEAVFVGTEKVGNMNMYVLDLKAKKVDAAYYKRKLWIDQQKYIVVREEMYAKSGKMLKLMINSDAEQIGSRYFPLKTRIEDKLKLNSFSEIIYSNTKMDEPLSDSIFTIQNLEQKH